MNCQYEIAPHKRVKTHAGDVLGFTNEGDIGPLGAVTHNVTADVIKSPDYTPYDNLPEVGDTITAESRRYERKYSLNVDIGLSNVINKEPKQNRKSEGI